ncbi:ABC transporter permease subunit [Kordiimonas sp. SCSIO 12603]|uniref:ABC transporter permease/M1 family aminopeptidase n=1 Tax=Kordiimonas sp. SCSIO 12603 TaxID=2829596 RepID=UPI00210206FA|nr:ABC transporter permease subunit [Kordiimonas sp. SCSIO 12603]UTW59427.1 ABC transporter permease subunit [Kordiimonas sp. SCSIO 12603]
MLLRIAANEFRYMFKSPQTIVTFAIFFLLPFMAMVFSDNVQIGAGGNVKVNSPFAIAQINLILNLFSVFVAPAFMANAVLKDSENKMDGILFSTPITKEAYLFGRFIGAFLAMFVAMSGTPIGMAIGSAWPTLDPETVLPFSFGNYAYTFFALTGPTLLVMGSLFFAIAVMTRSLMGTYLIAMGVLILYFISARFFREPEMREIMAIVDPFLIRGMQEVTRYWTAVERNTLLLTYEGLILTNRLVWFAVSGGLVALAYGTFSFRKPAKLPKEKKAKKQDQPKVATAPRLTPTWTRSTYFSQFMMRTKFEVGSVVKSLPFMIIIGFSLFMMISALLNRNLAYGLDALPVTRLMINAVQGGLGVGLIIVLIFYSADIIWRERHSGVHEIVDASPIPSNIFVASKLVSLAVVLAIILSVGVILAIGVQILSGYGEIDLGLYMQRGIYRALLGFVLIAVLSSFLQVIAKNRFVGMMLMMLYFISTLILSSMGFEHPLYLFGSGITAPMSDMNGNGRFLSGDNWINLYWSFFSVILIMLSYMLWNRGTLQPIKLRLRALRGFKKPVPAVVAILALIGFAASGRYIYYNTNILNDYLTGDDIEELRAEYEEKYRQYEDLPMPRIVDVKIDVDLYPYKRRVETRGKQVLKNKTGEVINTVHMVFPGGIDEIPMVELEGGSIESIDEDYSYYIFKMDEPIQPGEERKLAFETIIQQRGFRHSGADVTLVRNGTFINNGNITPTIGFSRGLMIQDRNTRRKRGLEPLPRTPKLEDESQYSTNYISSDSDFVTFETTVSTVADQIAVAPGYLQKEWAEGDRRYFHYTMDAPILNFYSYLSADYTVVRDEVDGVDIEVYHHAPHTYNVNRMIESVKDSIRYFSKAFSPYQHKQLRILEFPAYRSFAQAFPNTVPYSEGIGFIADLSDPNAIDLAYYVTAHEVAHQWWAHQVMSANTQGGTVLVETLAQYGAMLVMEQKYGPHQMRKFLKYELDRYLRGRSSDPEGELPLYRVENQQYIHYRKGSVVMYALKDYLGEEVVNRALSRLIEERGFSGEPYATTLDLLRILKEEAGPEHEQLIEDLFERITLFDLKADGVTVTPMEDGKYKVVMTIDAAKFEADNVGNETDLTLNDLVDIGVFTARPDDAGFGAENVLYLQKQRITADTKTIEIIVDGKPAFVGIDPYNKLVDRNSNDNIKEVVEEQLVDAG